MPVPDALLALLRPRLDHPTFEWLEEVVQVTTAPFDPRTFRAEWARVGRRTGSYPVEPTVEEREALRDAGIPQLHGWGVDELARVVLIVRALQAAEPATHLPFVQALYLRGTIRERQALLRSLAWLPEPGRFAELAAQAAQTHVVSVFEALAAGNPYPARWLVRPIFDQLVRKAISLRIPPDRIYGLADRVTTEPMRPRVTTSRPTAHAALPALLAP